MLTVKTSFDIYLISISVLKIKVINSISTSKFLCDVIYFLPTFLKTKKNNF